MCQRVMIAMALACEPRLLIADEPTTALDVTIQAQILDLLLSLKRERQMALVLITHDLGLVAEHADRVTVQYAGRQVEANDAAPLFADPHHPYTAALLAALPERATARRLEAIPGVVPGQFNRPAGCLFAPRCGFADERCRTTPPSHASAELGQALCHYPLRDGIPMRLSEAAA
jgi:dipeptide transport system ATP-binding protein